MHLLRLVKTNSAKISAASLINLVGMSAFWLALFDYNILISFRTSTFNKQEIKIRFRSTAFFDCNNTQVGRILQIALMTGSLIFSDVRSIWLNCRMFRLITTLEKNVFKTLALSLSLLITWSPSTIIIFSFEIILFW